MSAKVELANYPGWRLPTQGELPLMYEQQKVIGWNWSIWSSTEVDSDRVWVISSDTGEVFPQSKKNSFRVRAIKDF